MLDKAFVTLPRTRGGVPGGGAQGQVLIKNSGTVFDHGWSSILTLPEVTFSSLSLLTPSVPGGLANVSDSNTNVWGATVAGGGTNHVLVRYNGSVWTVVGK